MKYTCDCCGHKTLHSNAEGEICPVCFWEEEYLRQDDLLDMSSCNHMTLYEAQENYIKSGSCNRYLLKYCRKPLADEIKDENWVSVQVTIENKYVAPLQVANELHKLANLLKQDEAKNLYDNFKTLNEVGINYDYAELEFIRFRDNIDSNKLQRELLLKALSIKFAKNNLAELVKIFEDFYRKGICYYISWVIMLLVIIDSQQPKSCVSFTDLLLDIECNHFYGIKKLEKALNEYWCAEF